MRIHRIRTVGSFKGQLKPFLALYGYKPELTSRLDALRHKPLSQDTINEMVLLEGGPLRKTRKASARLDASAARLAPTGSSEGRASADEVVGL